MKLAVRENCRLAIPMGAILVVVLVAPRNEHREIAVITVRDDRASMERLDGNLMFLGSDVGVWTHDLKSEVGCPCRRWPWPGDLEFWGRSLVAVGADLKIEG